MAQTGSKYLDDGFSDESDHEAGYDSEAAEFSKGGRSVTSERTPKRRKLSRFSSEGEIQLVESSRENKDNRFHADERDCSDREESNSPNLTTSAGKVATDQADSGVVFTSASTQVSPPTTRKRPKDALKGKSTRKPGVIYLSSLPPYLRPSALRNLLTQRGFGPIERLFLTPASKAASTSKKNSRQLYTEGWIEFGSKKVAKACAETLNANPIGGKKGGFYRDDVWNMKYLKGMGWDELMAGVREERREEEGRQDEERRIIAGEAKRFVEGVERGKREDGMKRKRKKSQSDAGGGIEVMDQIKRTWRQFEVKGRDTTHGQQTTSKPKEVIEHDVKAVLGKIF